VKVVQFCGSLDDTWIHTILDIEAMGRERTPGRIMRIYFIWRYGRRVNSRKSFCWASHSFSNSLDENAAFYLMQWKESECKEMSLFASCCSLKYQKLLNFWRRYFPAEGIIFVGIILNR
jgi:hypothetical protein